MYEMKDSGVAWIGEIPSNWRVVSTKYLFHILSGATPDSSKPENWDGDINWVTPADYKTSDIFVTTGRRSLTQIGFDSCSTNMIPAGNIIFSKRAPIGSVAINKSNLCTNQGCLSCVSKGNSLVKYYYYVMSIATEHYELLGSGTTFKEISAASFSNFLLPNPNYQAQTEISEFLDRRCSLVDALAANVQSQIEKLKAYKQSLITEAVTKGLDSTVPMKDSGVDWIGHIPNAWEVKPMLSEIETVVDYRGKTPEKVDAGILLVTARNIKDGKIDYSISQEYVRSNEYEEIMHRGKLNIGDILFTTEAPLGAVANVDRTDFALAQRIIKFTTKSTLNPYYLKYWMLSLIFQQHLKSYATGSTASGIKASKLCLLKLVNPPRLEQDDIVSYLDKKCSQIDRLIAIKQAKIEKLEQYKRSLIYEYVTGKKEVS